MSKLRDAIKHSIDQVTEDKKRSKPSVNYSEGMPQAHCGICKHIVKSETGLRCELVKGSINPRYWCKLFERAQRGNK